MDSKDLITVESNEEVEVLTEAWKLSGFIKEVNKVFNQISEEDTEIQKNTINNYIKDLEEKGIHYVQRMNDTRVFDKDDLQIVLFILSKRSKKISGENIWSLPQIYEEIQRSTTLPKRTPVETKNNGSTEIIIQEEMNKIRNEFSEFVQKFVHTEKLLIENKEYVTSKVNKTLLDFLNTQSKVKEQARLAWEALPDKTRFKGIIFKQEDIAARERFIDDYIEREMLKWMLETNTHNAEDGKGE